MKINGESINADYLSFHVFNDGTARLALDHDKGALLIHYDYRKTPVNERENMLCEPVALEFTGDGKGRALFKEGWRDDPETGARTWARPSIPCRVEKVPYDAEEKKLYERNMRKREAQKSLLEEEKQRAEKVRKQAELDRRFKVATIALAEGGATKPKRRMAVTVKRAAKLCDVSERQMLNWEAGKNTPKDWPGRDNLKRLMQWQADRVQAKKIGVRIDNAARYGNIDSVSARKSGGITQQEKDRQAEFDKSIDHYSRDDDND